MDTVRDKFWLWGHEAGSPGGPPGNSRITAAEAAFYMDVPNLILVRFREPPVPPLDRYAVPLRPLKRVVWCITRLPSEIAVSADERQQIIDLASRCDNSVGVIMDDLFNQLAEGGKPLLSVQELKDVRAQLAASKRPLGVWVVMYDFLLDLPVARHLELCDTITFWTWKQPELANLERNFERLEKLTPGKSKVLGCYMWDWAAAQPIPVKVMQRQCELGLRWLREGRIEGMIFLASCICDLELETVEWTRRWIAEVGKQPLVREKKETR